MLVEVRLPLSTQKPGTFVLFVFPTRFVHVYIIMQDSKNIRSKLYAVARLVEVLHYEVENRGFGSRWDCSGRTVVLGSTQHLTDPSTWGKGSR